MRILKLFILAVFTLSLAAPAMAMGGPGRGRGTKQGNKKFKELKKDKFLPELELQKGDGAAIKGALGSNDDAYEAGDDAAEAKPARVKKKKRYKKAEMKKRAKKDKAPQAKPMKKKREGKSPFSGWKSSEKKVKGKARRF